MGRDLYFIPCALCGNLPNMEEHFNWYGSDNSFVYSIYCCLADVSFKNRKAAITKWNFLQLIYKCKITIMSDEERRQFILDLDKSDLDITDWEAQFCKSVIDKRLHRFSDKQRESIDKMVIKYDDQLL